MITIAMFNWIYNEEKLKNDAEVNNKRSYQECTKTVMDTIRDPNIYFDEQGISNYYHEYNEAKNKNVFKGAEGENKIQDMVQELKQNQKGKYDSIIGLSGGVDSTYLVYKTKQC